MGFIIIYITHSDLKTAKKIAGELMKKRLVACANFFPIQNSYWWKGKIEYACGMLPSDLQEYHKTNNVFVSFLGTIHGLQKS